MSSVIAVSTDDNAFQDQSAVIDHNVADGKTKHLTKQQSTL